MKCPQSLSCQLPSQWTSARRGRARRESRRWTQTDPTKQKKEKKEKRTWVPTSSFSSLVCTPCQDAEKRQNNKTEQRFNETHKNGRKMK